MTTKTDFSDCPQLLRDFLYYMLTIRGRSQRTVEGYHIDLRLFLRYIKYVNVLGSPDGVILEELSIEDLSPEIICSITLSDAYAYLNYTLSDRGNRASARSRKVSALHGFYKYITSKTAYLDENPLKDLEIPSPKRAVPRYLTLDESRELLIHVPDGPHYERDYCIVTLLLNCGMRLSELCGINLNDVRDNTLRLLGKGNKERVVYLNNACLDALEQYRKVRKAAPKESHALFLSRNGSRISPRRVEQIIEACLKESQLDGQGYSPHKLRHTAATLMYQNGVDIRALKEILGHENLSTTEIYTHVSDKQLEHAVESSPLANFSHSKRRTAAEREEKGVGKDENFEKIQEKEKL